jgi:uncharacterized membrane protein YoaK (UPF0700 family)
MLALLDTLSQKTFSLNGAVERQLMRSLILLLGFGCGCIVAAYAVLWWADWAWAVPSALVGVAVVITGRAS